MVKRYYILVNKFSYCYHFYDMTEIEKMTEHMVWAKYPTN